MDVQKQTRSLLLRKQMNMRKAEKQRMTLEEFEAIFKERDEAKSPEQEHAKVVREAVSKSLRDVDKLYVGYQSATKTQAKANTRQVAGDHYKSKTIQPWDAMEAWLTPEQFRGFLLGTSVKYLARAGDKGDFKEDIEKAHHYIEKLLETLR